MKRVAVFIDGNNFYYSLRGLGRKKVDFMKLIDMFVGDGKLVKVFYYNALLDIEIGEAKYWGQQKFFDKLRGFGFDVKLGRLRKHKKGGEYFFDVKGDDVFLVTDLVSGAYEGDFDEAVLVSGDEDFVPAVCKVQKLGKSVINAYFKRSSSSVLKGLCNSSICLNDYINKICPALPEDHTGCILKEGGNGDI